MSDCENPASGATTTWTSPLNTPADNSNHHQSVRASHSIGADSAIEMHDDCCLQHDGTSSSTSSRPVSRTTDLAPSHPGPTFTISPQSSVDSGQDDKNQEPAADLDPMANRHFPTRDLIEPPPDNFPPVPPHLQHPQNGFLETVNPAFSRPPSVAYSQHVHGPPLHQARTYPTLSRPASTCSSGAFRYGPAGGQMVPLHGGMYGVYCPSRGSPYYTVQSPHESLSSAGSLYGGTFSPDQPRDVRVGNGTNFPFPKQPLRKTDSMATTCTDPSAYYGDEYHAKQRPQVDENAGSLSDKEKNQLFRHLITKTLSSVYAIFVIVLGAILYVNDVLGTVGHSYVEVFQVYLFMVAITFYIFIHIDIRRYVKTEQLAESLANMTSDEMRASSFHQQLPFMVASQTVACRPVSHHHPQTEAVKPKQRPYGFNTGRHADSLYLKLGAVAFCFGSMIHDGLVFSKRLDIVVTQPFSSCMNVIDLFTPALNLVFSFYQLYFIFKHSNIIIHRYQEIARFGVMHSIAVNLCVWFRTLVDETIDEFSRKWSGEGSEGKESAGKTADAQFKMMPEDAGWHGPAPASSAAAAGLRAMDHNHTSAALSLCSPETVLANIAQEAAPYLYPFTIEYTLIAAAVWYMIWSNIGGNGSHNVKPTYDAEKSSMSGPSGPLQSACKGDSGGEASSKSSSYMIHVDCRSTNRGLFPGILVLVGTVISIIIFFVTISAEEYATTALIINNVSELSLYTITGVVTIFAFRKTATLNLNHGAMKHTLDDFLLFVALPCFFIFSFFSIIAGIAASNPLSIVVNTASMVQVILQTTFIFDGLRRCSNTRDLQRKKPGREMITFLIVCNVAMWTFSTFEIKRSETNPSQMLFYGEFEWSIISHLSVPLTIFYRFHSSVCLVDIWRSAYQAADAH